MNDSIRVGTASWSEPEFVKAGWYPPGLPAGQRLGFYSERFDMVELNSSFYAIPLAGMCERWVAETPKEFLFDVKCHRLLSRHATQADALPQDLREAAELTDRGNVILTPALEDEVAGRFLDGIAPVERAGKLGALLLQMTPGFAPRAADLTALEGYSDNSEAPASSRVESYWNCDMRAGLMAATGRIPRRSCVTRT